MQILKIIQHINSGLLNNFKLCQNREKIVKTIVEKEIGSQKNGL